jgi:hypothetical protein
MPSDVNAQPWHVTFDTGKGTVIDSPHVLPAHLDDFSVEMTDPPVPLQAQPTDAGDGDEQDLSDTDTDDHPVEIQETFPTWAFLQGDGKFAPYEALACETIEDAY